MSIEGLNSCHSNNISNPSGLQARQSVSFDELDKSLTSKEKTIFNSLIKFFNRYSTVYPRQDTIGLFSGCCRETVNRAKKKFEQIGLIAMDYRYHTSGIYHLNPVFNDIFARRRFSRIFPALKTIVLALLMSNVTLYKNINNLHDLEQENLIQEMSEISLTKEEIACDMNYAAAFWQEYYQKKKKYGSCFGSTYWEDIALGKDESWSMV